MNRRETFAWTYVGYLLFVILFGAWVRISGSGNGCGNHWPLCNAEIIPQAPTTKTIIEFTHRLTSGASGLMGFVLLVWSYRRRNDEPLFYRFAWISMGFLIVEALLGAVLVKRELVANNASVSRAVTVSLHLVNTMMLMASAALAAWFSGNKRQESPIQISRGVWILALLAFIATNMTGAITALGDTLFPVPPATDGHLWAHVRTDLSASQHFLVRLRLIHPIVAMLTAIGIGGLYLRLVLMGGGTLAHVGMGLVLAQVSLGFLNVALAAPAWTQLAHLLLAQCLWMTSCLAALIYWPRLKNQP